MVKYNYFKHKTKPLVAIQNESTSKLNKDILEVQVEIAGVMSSKLKLVKWTDWESITQNEFNKLLIEKEYGEKSKI